VFETVADKLSPDAEDNSVSHRMLLGLISALFKFEVSLKSIV
jgi:hypothetical protein